MVLGLVRARRRDAGHRPLLDEARSLAEPTRMLALLKEGFTEQTSRAIHLTMKSRDRVRNYVIETLAN